MDVPHVAIKASQADFPYHKTQLAECAVHFRILGCFSLYWRNGLCLASTHQHMSFYALKVHLPLTGLACSVEIPADPWQIKPPLSSFPHWLNRWEEAPLWHWTSIWGRTACILNLAKHTDIHTVDTPGPFPLHICAVVKQHCVGLLRLSLLIWLLRNLCIQEVNFMVALRRQAGF